jgi:hypothetical protein
MRGFESHGFLRERFDSGKNSRKGVGDRHQGHDHSPRAFSGCTISRKKIPSINNLRVFRPQSRYPFLRNTR